MIAVGSGTGVGINALLSKSLGEKNFDLADKTAENGIFLAVLSYLLFAVIGVLFSKPFFLLQTTDPEIVENRRYLPDALLCMLLRHVPAIHIRAAAAIDWAHILYDDHPRAGRYHQHHPGPDHDFWPF